VRDLQHRLVALGVPVDGDAPGAFGPGTRAAVRTFQSRRGLHDDGVCGADTWAALVEAGWRLGDRSLYRATPMLRGDDVAELQRRLGTLGFDAGRVDGIFGPLTERALVEFQRNGGLVTDAVCGPATLTALARLGPTGSGEPAPQPIASVRERERHRRGPHSLGQRTIAVGETGGLDATCRALAAALRGAGAHVVLLQHPDGSAQAAQANALEADAYVGLSLAEGAAGGCSVAYYRSPSGWESPEGRALAELVHAALLPTLGAADGGVRGMAVPVLRETRMPAVVAELGAATVVVERTADVAAVVTDALRRWVAC
jgi:N-acetylmuramoyl-L-alanine amidase